MRSAPLALLLAFAAAAPTAAQDPSDNPADDVYAGVLADGPTVSARQAMEACLEFPAAWVRRHSRAAKLRPNCQVDDTGELERTPDRTWSWTRYRWTTVIPPDDPAVAPPDTIVEEEVVLFSAPLDRDERTAEWHVRYWTLYTSRVTVQVASTGDDGALLSVEPCANGTAGCGQLFLLRDGRGWRPVRDAWMEQLPAGLGAFRKGAYINSFTLLGQAALYAPDDANCCPSSILYVRVRLDGDSLVLRDHRVVPSD